MKYTSKELLEMVIKKIEEKEQEDYITEVKVAQEGQNDSYYLGKVNALNETISFLRKFIAYIQYMEEYEK